MADADRESCAQALAGFVMGLRWERIPPARVAQAKWLVLDTLGLCLAASTLEFGQMATRVVRDQGGVGESTVIGAGDRVPMASAALVNGVLAHGLDFDDTHEEAIVHTGCCAVTAALAAGEAAGADGRAVLEAVVAAAEVICRVGVAAVPALHERGFHATGLCGGFGAAAAAARLLGLGPAALAQAWGCVGSQAGGLLEFLADESWSKRLHAGWAAHSGIVATLLAREGFRGPATVFEGRFGFYRAFAGEGRYDLQRLTDGLGEHWEVARVALKPYPCAHLAHPYLDCALRLRRANALRPEQIVEVRCRVAKAGIPLLWEPLAEKRRPRSGYGARFSLPYSLAVVLAEGRAGVREFSEDRLADARVQALADRITYVHDPELDRARSFVGDVEIQTTSGQVFREQQTGTRGGETSPLTPEEIRAKFRENATLAIPGPQAEAIREHVEHLEEVRELAGLAALLRTGPVEHAGERAGTGRAC